jgi:uncharacterized protein
MALTTKERIPRASRPETLVWRRIDHPGHEWCSLTPHDKGAILQGVVVLQWERLPCNITYVIKCNADWSTRVAILKGTIGPKQISVTIKADRKGHWFYNGELVSSVNGCVDVDLGFSPSTNLLPIRRLELVAGRDTDVTAAWVAFPSLKLKPLHQVYTKIDDHLIHYESADGRFKRDLVVNRLGFILDYPGLWRAEIPS